MPEKVSWLAGILVAVAVFLAGRAWLMAQHPMEMALVAARQIQPFTVIRQEDLVWRQVPMGGREPGSIQDPALLVGRTALGLIYANEQIRAERVGDDPFAPGPGEAMVSVPSDLIRSVGGTLRPGARVDVWWSPGGAPEKGVLIAPGSTVMALKNSQNEVITPSAGRATAIVQEATEKVVGAVNSGSETSRMVPTVVILKIRREDGGRFSSALSNGVVYLVRVNQEEAVEFPLSGPEPKGGVNDAVIGGSASP